MSWYSSAPRRPSDRPTDRHRPEDQNYPIPTSRGPRYFFQMLYHHLHINMMIAVRTIVHPLYIPLPVTRQQQRVPSSTVMRNIKRYFGEPIESLACILIKCPSGHIMVAGARGARRTAQGRPWYPAPPTGTHGPPDAAGTLPRRQTGCPRNITTRLGYMPLRGRL